jgi:hypothetical protein
MGENWKAYWRPSSLIKSKIKNKNTFISANLNRHEYSIGAILQRH